jgi:hypothetical protein
MFKKISFLSLFVVTAVQADVRIAALLDVSHNDSRVAQECFDNVIYGNHYVGITSFRGESGYELGFRIISVSDTIVTVELFVADANRKLIYNQTLACAWNTPVSITSGTRDYENRIDELIKLTITLSQQHTATPEEIAACSTKLAVAYTLRNMFVTLPPIAGIIAAGVASNVTYNALVGSSEMLARGAALVAALVALPSTGIIASSPAVWLSSKYKKYFSAESFRLIEKEAHTKSMYYEAYSLCGIAPALLIGLIVKAAN